MPKDTHQEFWEDKGKWKPLSVWVGKGYDGAMLVANSSAKDRRPDPVFGEVSSERAQNFIADAVRALALEGMPQRLSVLTQRLKTHTERLKAFRLAFQIASASAIVAWRRTAIDS